MIKVKKQLPESNWDELARLQEDTDKQLERERVPHQEDWKNEERQRGLSIHSNELIRRVKKMNPAIWAEDSQRFRDRVGFYYSTPLWDEKRFTGAHFKKGMVHEFSRIFTDLADRPVAIEYGWREVLHRLMKKRLISWDEVKRNFPIYDSAVSEAFDRQTQKYKN